MTDQNKLIHEVLVDYLQKYGADESIIKQVKKNPTMYSLGSPKGEQ